ncbi:hypothetical protein EV421DRAFT_1214904 [Armillaria borealis]|uniref:F-box domain-containing protein n=1 Tax=Armillaria borealis TaxID=47425 RepID=A0AA39MJ92_9AGAR|nr:hypothetical protein EV421DRAFT_1214904 [Armillaria borealis]
MSSIPMNPPDTRSTCGSITKTTFSCHSRSSRVSELLQRNDPPSDSELSDFQNITKSGPGRIADLDEKIDRAREHLAALIDERSLLQAEIDDARALSSPIRRLPSDVLRTIAQLEVIPSPYEVLNPITLRVDSANSLDSRESPWTLAQVSHRWRFTIVNAPELWSSMSLVINDEGPTTVARQMFLTGLRLEQSKYFPLTLSLSVYSYADISNHPLLSLISTRISSIRNLRIQASLISYSAFSWWRGRLDRLYHLAIVANTLGLGPQSAGGTESILDTFECAPQLKMITLEGFPSATRFPGTQITHLNLSIINWNDVEILRQFHNLSNLHIAYSSSSLPSGHRIISLPALTSLTLTYQYRRWRGPPTPFDFESDPTFSLLSIPNLTHLWLVYTKGFTVFPTIPTPNTITALRIEFSGGNDMPYPPDRKLSTLFESVTNLRDLIISESPAVYGVSVHVLSLVHIHLHHLRTLDIRGSTLRLDHMQRFVGMVEGHRQGNSGEMDQMETVYLRYPLTLDPIYARRWQSLIDGGLKVVYGRPEL